jgi:hypothetical protein
MRGRRCGNGVFSTYPYRKVSVGRLLCNPLQVQYVLKYRTRCRIWPKPTRALPFLHYFSQLNAQNENEPNPGVPCCPLAHQPGITDFFFLANHINPVYRPCPPGRDAIGCRGASPGHAIRPHWLHGAARGEPGGPWRHRDDPIGRWRRPDNGRRARPCAVLG